MSAAIQNLDFFGIKGNKFWLSKKNALAHEICNLIMS